MPTSSGYGDGVDCSPSASTSAGEAAIENNGWMDQWTILQLTPNYYLIIEICVKYCSILKILQFYTELMCRAEKSVRVQNVTREEREIFKEHYIGRRWREKNHLQSVRDKSKGQTKCQTGL